MAHPPNGRRRPDEATPPEPGREVTPSTPRWVKVFGVVAAVLVLLFILLHLIGRSPAHH